jgi:acyl-CoA dehydrogenase
MLMDCLAAGRSVSLPALSVSAGKSVSRVTGAYARVRKQFKLPLGRFEGVEEPLARIAGYTYMMDAARTLTTRALDAGEQPAVASAIVKYQLTEHMRRIVNDAMDIHGGTGICLGPQNLIARAYQGVPISITVEGANILTRTLIVYGQGAIRCHPHLREEMESVADADRARALRRFDKALFGHIGFVVTNLARTFWRGLTAGLFIRVPISGPASRYAQRLSRLSSAFALLSDASLFVYGGSLKRREKTSGRLADALSFLYLASATIKRFEDDNRPREDEKLLRYACEYCLYQVEQSILVVLKNYPVWVRLPLTGLIFPTGKRHNPPSDHLGHEIADLLLAPSAVRDRLTAGIYLPKNENEQMGRLDLALVAVIAAEASEKKLQKFVDGHPMLIGDLEAQLAEAMRVGVLSAAEAVSVRESNRLRRAVIRVDDFAPADI